MENRSITFRCSTEVYERHEAAARGRGLTLARHVADLVERVDPAMMITMTPAVDEIAERRARQLAALDREGLLDDAARQLLMPKKLPPVLESALAAAQRGGPGFRFFGMILGRHLRGLLGEDTDALDEVLAGSSRAVATAELGDLLRERVPAVAEAIAGKHENTVLDAALTELLVGPQSERDV